MVLEGQEGHALRPGSVVFVPPQHQHQFQNTGSTPLKFLCLIPHPLRAWPARVHRGLRLRRLNRAEGTRDHERHKAHENGR